MAAAGQMPPLSRLNRREESRMRGLQVAEKTRVGKTGAPDFSNKINTSISLKIHCMAASFMLTANCHNWLECQLVFGHK